MSMNWGRDDFDRLMKMVHAAQDFGLGADEARAIAALALERFDLLSDACDWAAGVLAERVLVAARGNTTSRR
jgi:hypothetical protein